MELRLDLGPDRLTIDDMIMLEEGEEMSMRELRKLLASFATDENGEPLPLEDAEPLVGKLSISEFYATINRMKDAVEDIKDGAVSSGQ